MSQGRTKLYGEYLLKRAASNCDECVNFEHIREQNAAPGILWIYHYMGFARSIGHLVEKWRRRTRLLAGSGRPHCRVAQMCRSTQPLCKRQLDQIAS